MIPFLVGGAAFIAASCRWNWWRLPVKNGLPILTYHKVGNYPPGSRLKPLWVTEKQFRDQMTYLKAHGYTTLTMTELRDIDDGKKQMPAKPVLVTFDDGYENNYTLAYPILKELGMKGNIFLVHDTLEGMNAWHNPATEPNIPMMSWAQAKEMQDSGVIEFGSHTLTHRNLTSIPLEDARRELDESKAKLEAKLGREMVGFAYPYGAGAFHADVRKAARDAGYRYDFAFRRGLTPWPWKPEHGPILRIYVRGDDNAFDFYLNLTRGRARF
jgi:peptidoglycan/xylan/chitin deacetylase (PgdA/CDA1 family)